jgi:hypothetical protein
VAPAAEGSPGGAIFQPYSRRNRPTRAGAGVRRPPAWDRRALAAAACRPGRRRGRQPDRGGAADRRSPRGLRLGPSPGGTPQPRDGGGPTGRPRGSLGPRERGRPVGGAQVVRRRARDRTALPAWRGLRAAPHAQPAARGCHRPLGHPRHHAPADAARPLPKAPHRCVGCRAGRGTGAQADHDRGPPGPPATWRGS